MKILLSAYACRPRFGSEHAIGWNFTNQLLKMGHQVTVITNDECRSDIENYGGPLPPNLTIIYHRLPLLIKKNLYRKTGPLAHIYYFFWQISSFICLRKIYNTLDIELIHLITLGVFRTPVFLGLLPAPFVLGPVGGGETSTKQLEQRLPLAYRIKERIRHWANLSALINPLMYITYNTTDLILLKTNDNLKYIPKTFHKKCKLSLEVGVNEDQIIERNHKDRHDKPLKILFAGRLEYWKGTHLAIKSFSRLIKQHHTVEFTIIGSGSEEKWFKQIAKDYNVLDKIQWMQRVSQERLFQIYEEYDLLLFPSMHDSSGNVIVESLCFGLPVVCLDLGGPKEIVDETCGIVISTLNTSEEEVIMQIVTSITTLLLHPEKLSALSRNALLRAGTFTWSKVVNRTYALIDENIHTPVDKQPA